VGIERPYPDPPLTDRPPSDIPSRSFKYQVHDSRQLSTSSRPVMATALKSSTSDTSIPGRSNNENPAMTSENTEKERLIGEDSAKGACPGAEMVESSTISSTFSSTNSSTFSGTNMSENTGKERVKEEGGKRGDDDVRRQLEDIRGSLERIVIVVAQLTEKYC